VLRHGKSSTRPPPKRHGSTVTFYKAYVEAVARSGGEMKAFGRVMLGAALSVLSLGASSADQRLTVEEGALSVEIDGHTTALSAMIVKRAGVEGRQPLAIVAHGSPRDPDERATYDARAMLPTARDLAHRGWLVVLFLRRGFGSSQGPFVEGYDCARPNYRKALATAARDIEAVRAAMERRRDVDATRVLGVGVSVGGAAMLAWASMQPRGAVAIVSLSGGTGAMEPGRNCDEDALVSVIGSYGLSSRVPTLWLYAENDTFFGPSVVQRMHAAYAQAGGAAEVNIFGRLKDDGHELWERFDGNLLWLPALDRFLRAHGLPTWEAEPMEQIARRLGGPAHDLFRSYLAAPTEKAFAVSRDRRLARYWSQVGDLEVARRESVAACERDSGGNCEVLVEDFVPAKTR
jgi:pimeloyl-ACP methyl ester carboxylesterase